nr:MAG TPA: hypothetical protein [Caudoviricetes sp.]DAX31009.1 MAG TPA: hypothetical protein [Caudoviricetes sp.]
MIAVVFRKMHNDLCCVVDDINIIYYCQKIK